MDPILVTLTNGSIIDLTRLAIEHVAFQDVVDTLSITPRYGARTSRLGQPYAYSVLQHSLFLAQLVPSRYRRQALSHDFPEAYLPDIPSTIKDLTPWYGRLEDQIWDVLMVALDLEPVDQVVWAADLSIRDIERSFLFPNQRTLSRPHAYLEFIVELKPDAVRTVFREKWREVTAYEGRMP